LDTVKNQLHDASLGEPAAEVANAAKALDQQSTELVSVFQDFKDDMPDEVKIKMTEAEVAAVNTGVKAVQVLIESHDRPEVKDVMSDEELLQMVNQRLQGMEVGISDAAQKIGAASGTVASISATTSTVPVLPLSEVSSTQAQLKSAQTSLAETRQLIEENKFDLVGDKLAETANAVATVEKSVDALSVNGTASGTVAVPPSTVTSTATLTASSTNSTTTLAKPTVTIIPSSTPR